MIEDKLTHDERRRLECLAQAIHVAAHTSTPLAIIEDARRFEEYVAGPEGLDFEVPTVELVGIAPDYGQPDDRETIRELRAAIRILTSDPVVDNRRRRGAWFDEPRWNDLAALGQEPDDA